MKPENHLPLANALFTVNTEDNYGDFCGIQQSHVYAKTIPNHSFVSNKVVLSNYYYFFLVFKLPNIYEKVKE